jgi:hypothetical protein
MGQEDPPLRDYRRRHWRERRNRDGRRADHAPRTNPAVGRDRDSASRKKHLGLDERRSWVIVTDLNVFHWPGIDIWRVPGSPAGTYDYGLLPSKLFEQIKARILKLSSHIVATPRPERRTTPRAQR